MHLHRVHSQKAMLRSRLLFDLPLKPDKGVYTDVSDRRMHALLTLQAKIPSTFPLFEGIFTYEEFVSSLSFVRQRIVQTPFTMETG